MQWQCHLLACLPGSMGSLEAATLCWHQASAFTIRERHLEHEKAHSPTIELEQPQDLERL